MKYFLPVLLVFLFASCKSKSGLESVTALNNGYDIYLREIAVTRIDTTDDIGERWTSDSSVANLSAALFKAVETKPLYSTPIRSNVLLKDLPVSWQTPDIRMNNSQWRLVLYNTSKGYQEEMAQFTFNGNNLDTSGRLANARGFEVVLKTEKRENK